MGNIILMKVWLYLAQFHPNNIFIVITQQTYFMIGNGADIFISSISRTLPKKSVTRTCNQSR